MEQEDQSSITLPCVKFLKPIPTCSSAFSLRNSPSLRPSHAITSSAARSSIFRVYPGKDLACNPRGIWPFPQFPLQTFRVWCVPCAKAKKKGGKWTQQKSPERSGTDRHRAHAGSAMSPSGLKMGVMCADPGTYGLRHLS